ncbi:SGNH/GDSL hydrolase family protein [Streptomyces ossamyceticus]|uniref:SGNH/GDSL hydrolase family protein n=1 Tax=Streptomyces ossamyceticus TaxID=249581 RepID=UPI0036E1F2FD
MADTTPGARTAPRPAAASAPAQAYVLTLVLLVATTVIGALPARADTHRGPSAAARHWTGTWAAASSGTVPALPGASIRNVVHVGVGGTAARIRISNRLGTAPLRLGAVTVALQVPGAPGRPDAVPGSQRAATFGGARTVVVPPGRDRVTDPVALRVPAYSNLLITLHTPADSGPATYHRSARQTGFVAPRGDRTADEHGSAFTTTVGSWYYVTGVDVLGTSTAGSVVALGDSITDGNGSTADANRRWPDRLAERLRALPAQRRPGVLNAGISGNRLLRTGVGPSALARLDADVLTRTGVRTLIVMEGINDIKGTPNVTDPAALTAGYRRIVARARAHGIRVIGATLTPFGGHGAYTAARERVRLAVNDSIRTGRVFDAVADFDRAVRDPAHPHRIRPAYDPGDHLHFNDAGMRALADAIDLADVADVADVP